MEVTEAHHKGCCEHCRREFLFEIIHNGHNGSAYAYCEDCGTTALLDTRHQERPGVPRHRKITAEGEPLLSACPCGGRFSAHAAPRCPNCRQPLDAVQAAQYVEAAIRPVAAGWKWQRNWSGLYCMIIEKRVVNQMGEREWPST